MGNGYEFYIKRKRDGQTSPCADQGGTRGRRGAYEGRGLVRNLADWATGGCLRRLVTVERLHGGKPEKGCQCSKCRKPLEFLHCLNLYVSSCPPVNKNKRSTSLKSAVMPTEYALIMHPNI